MRVHTHFSARIGVAAVVSATVRARPPHVDMLAQPPVSAIVRISSFPLALTRGGRRRIAEFGYRGWLRRSVRCQQESASQLKSMFGASFACAGPTARSADARIRNG
jgi:hypothetical protein